MSHATVPAACYEGAGGDRMTNGERLLAERPEVLADCLAERGSCVFCAFRGSCDEGQPYWERTCTEGVLEWLISEETRVEQG